MSRYCACGKPTPTSRHIRCRDCQRSVNAEYQRDYYERRGREIKRRGGLGGARADMEIRMWPPIEESVKELYQAFPHLENVDLREEAVNDH